MPRRQRTYNRSGSLLDAPIGIDPDSWANDSLLTKARPPEAPKPCHCPPPQKNRCGGCRPGLRWVSHTQVVPYCRVCNKALVAGTHRRRDQVRMIALAAMELEHLDLEDLKEWGVLTGERPAPEPTPAELAWPAINRAMARGPVVPDPDAIAAAAAALERAEATTAWLEEASA